MVKEVGLTLDTPPVAAVTVAFSLSLQSFDTVHAVLYPEPRGLAHDTTPCT